MWFFFFKQKTAYEMRISDWSSDVCSSDLLLRQARDRRLDLVLDLHLRDVGVGAFHEDRGDIRAPARAGLRAEIKEAVDPGQLLLEHLGDAVLDRFGRRAGIGGADLDLRRRDIGILLDRQRQARADAAEPDRSEERRVGEECV